MKTDDFSVRLKELMKKRRISGQKIADVVGVSQKTISRYVTGETIPKKEKQKKVLQAVAEISGHPEDAELETPKPPMGARETLKQMLEYPELFFTEDEIMEKELAEWEKAREKDKEKACKVFSLLEKKNKKHVIKNMDVYSHLDVHEIAMVENLAIISKEQREFILDRLETVRLGYEEMLQSFSKCEKIANYARMIHICADIIKEDVEKFKKLPNIIEDTRYLDEYMDKLEKLDGVHLERLGNYLDEMITFDARDWYFLMLVQMLSIKDQGSNSLYGYCVGDSVNNLARYMQQLAEKKIKEKKLEENLEESVID